MKTVNKKRIAIVVSIVCAIVFLLSVGILAATFVSATTGKITVEIGENPEPEKIHENTFLASLYEVEPYQIDVSEPGEHSIELKFFGFLPGKVNVEVCDTTPPVLELWEVNTVEGTEIQPEDFVRMCIDNTEVTYSFAEVPCEYTAGEYTVVIRAIDSAGNQTSREAGLKIWDTSHILRAEWNAADLEQTIREKHPSVTDVELGEISAASVGEYIIRAYSEQAAYIWPVVISDTTPPRVEVRDCAIRLGETIVPEDFILSVDEVSDYTVSFGRQVDFQKQGLKNILLLVEDSHGNKTTQTVRLLISDIPREMFLEYGVSVNGVGSSILERVSSKDRYVLSDCPTEIGAYDITVDTEYGSYTVKLEIADTTPPQLKLKQTTVFLGENVEPDYFVQSAEDASEVRYRYGGEAPVTDAVGEYSVSVTAADIYGNTTTVETVYTVILDTKGPVIYGVTDKEILVGESVSFKKGVYAVDDHDGNIAFKVDSSAVNTGEEGTYPVIYTSVDSSGNETSVTAYLKVKVNNMNAVNNLADEILKWIVTPSMTQREKAWAIYVWTTENLSYSTRTSYLMGNYIEGAYSGLSIRSGNCYIYYAVSGALLTRAGIENIMIQRDKPEDPHYWNLVNIDGSWYHFDTCPQFPGHEMQCFLKTDAELADYNKHEVADYYSFDASLYPPTP